jgi:pyridoxal phosphate enzyme (YggS family)
MSIAENIAQVGERIQMAARRVQRNPEEINLMAVSKGFPAEQIREAYNAGIRTFGENRVQEFAEKAEAVDDLEARWHLIGHLQTNKASNAARLFHAIDSLDSLRLARKLNSAAQEMGKKIPVLIEVNIGGEAAKSGVRPDSTQLNQLLSAAPELPSLEFRGLMAIPPYHDDPEKSRPFFREMQRLRKQISNQNLPGVSMEVLSIGMSHDFEIAIEEGSTCIRVGTAIFGERKSVRSQA